VTIGTQPLQPDIFVSVTYSLMQLTAGVPDGSEHLTDWRWRLSVQESNERFPGKELSTDRIDCPADVSFPCGAPNTCLAPAACMTNRFSFFLNRTSAIALTPNNGIVLNGIIVEINDTEVDTQPIDEVALGACRMSFVDQPLTFDTLQSGAFMTRTFQLAGMDGHNPEFCRGLVVAEISANCIGQGKGFCHAGSLCIADADCESGACSPSACMVDADCPSGTCVAGTCSIGSCESVCGNEMVEMPDETCDDGDTTGGDGCSATCQTEPGNVCSGMPSLCGTRTPTPTQTPIPTPTATP
jgi:cysteine-rich repeat protein